MATELIGGVEVHVDDEGFMTDPSEWNEELAPALAKEIGGQVTLTAYERFQLGEGIEKKEEDFAAEVAAMQG